MAMPKLPVLTEAILNVLNETLFTIWTNPQNPGLDFFYADMATHQGYTALDPYIIGMNVLQAPMVAPFADPRAILPVLDGRGRDVQYIDFMPIKVPIDGETVDEYEATKLVSKVFGADISKVPVEDRFAARFAYGKQAINNLLAVSGMNLIESATVSTVVQGADTGINIVNTFVRNTATALTDLDNNYAASYADLSSGALAGRKWVNADGTLNTDATPVADVQTQIAVLKRWGGGSVKYFIMDHKSLAAYNRDFKANYSDLFKNTNILYAPAMYSLPAEVQELGWAQIGHVHDMSEGGRLVPVIAGTGVQYMNWMKGNTLNDFLPAYPFSFPVGSVKTIGTKHTWIKLERLMKEKNQLGINLWMEEQSGAQRGEIHSRMTMYPSKSPNALVFWKTGPTQE